jgi:ribulose 1,5-bisphosphate synthetase/thiazole synthase
MGSAYFDAHSLWQRSEKPLFTSLMSDQRVDTCVIGAGIAGLTVAYQLLKAGQTVAV